MCNCHSYNKEKGSRPERILTLPSKFGLTYPSGEPKTTISVDACIADVIQHLWDNDIVTLNCCCGHGERKPSIILEDDCTQEEAERVRKAIKEIDKRDFDLLSWKLVTF